MDLIQNNAFGILGLTSDASNEDINERYELLIKVVKTGKTPEYLYDYDLYNKKRTIENIENAYKELKIREKKILHSFFRVSSDILDIQKKEAIILTFEIFDSSNYDQKKINKCIDLWKSLINGSYLSSFKQEYLKNNEIETNEEIIFKGIIKKLYQEVSYIISEISNRFNSDEVLKYFIEKFDIANQKISIPKVDNIIDDIYKVVDKLNGLKISEDGVFDDNEKRILNESIAKFKEDFKKIENLGLYESPNVLIVRDEVAECLDKQVLDLHDNLQEYKTAHELYKYIVPVSGTKDFKSKLEQNQKNIEKSFKEHENEKKDKQEEKQLNDESIYGESYIDEFKSKIDEIVKESNQDMEIYNRRIYQEVFYEVRHKPQIISRLVSYVEIKYGDKYVIGTWVDYYKDKIRKKELEEEKKDNQIESNKKPFYSTQNIQDGADGCFAFLISFGIIAIIVVLIIATQERPLHKFQTTETPQKVYTRVEPTRNYIDYNLLDYDTEAQEVEGNNNDYGEFELNLANDFIDEKDYFMAFKWLKKSAEKENRIAQYNLGIMYERGLGVKKDYRQAIDYYKKSANQGYADAQNELARMYDNGYGENKNYYLAHYWRKKAAEQGHAHAQLVLGIGYLTGHGVEKNYYEGVNWIKKSAEQGNELAKFTASQNFSIEIIDNLFQSSYKYMTNSYTKDELKVIKAIIGADATNSNWDLETFFKAILYQQKFDLKPDGKIGIATLRTILNDVNRMPANMPNRQTLINFLRYMVNKRR